MILLLNMKQGWLVFRHRDEHAPVTKEYPKYMYNNTRKEKKVVRCMHKDRYLVVIIVLIGSTLLSLAA